MYSSIAACWFSSHAEKLCAKSKQDFLLWLTWLPGTEELIHIHCVHELTDREKSLFAEHQFAWARLERQLRCKQFFLCLSVIWRLLEFGKRHRFEASVFFSSLFPSPPVKMPFYFHTWSSGTELLSQWILSDPSKSPVCLKHLGSESTCAGTILLHTWPEWTVLLAHTAMKMLCSTSWKYS